MRDLMIRESYTKDGVEKNSWNKVGILIESKEGKQYIKLYHLPGVLISVFEQKKKTERIEKADMGDDPSWDE